MPRMPDPALQRGYSLRSRQVRASSLERARKGKSPETLGGTVQHPDRRVTAGKRRGRARVVSGRRRAVRAAGPLMAGMLAAAFAVACSSGPSGAAASSTQTQSKYDQAVAYAQCMRSHGVPDFPDPNAKGEFALTGTNVNPGSQQFQSAQEACQHLDKNTGIQSPASHAAEVNQALQYVNCMRSHGVLNFPEPPADGQMKVPSSVDTSSPRFQAAQRACRSYLPGSATP